MKTDSHHLTDSSMPYQQKSTGSQKEIQEDQDCITQCSAICIIWILSQSVFCCGGLRASSISQFFFLLPWRPLNGIPVIHLSGKCLYLLAISQILELFLNAPLNFYILISHNHSSPLCRKLLFFRKGCIVRRQCLFPVSQLRTTHLGLLPEDCSLIFQVQGQVGHALCLENFIDTEYIFLKLRKWYSPA